MTDEGEIEKEEDEDLCDEEDKSLGSDDDGDQMILMDKIAESEAVRLDILEKLLDSFEARCLDSPGVETPHPKGVSTDKGGVGD